MLVLEIMIVYVYFLKKTTKHTLTHARTHARTRKRATHTHIFDTGIDKIDIVLLW